MRVSILFVVVAACFSPKFRSDIACSDFTNATDCPPGYGCIQPGTAGPEAAVCALATKCPTGIYCPIPLQCAGVQKICLVSPCGNGVMDPGEDCDDGNIVDGDGCDHDCHLERCGDGVLQPSRGEVCDLGDAMNGKCMGCSADCKSLERCGDGIIDSECGEICDNGPNPTNACNGCDAQCKSKQTCGNGIVDTECGEVCNPPGGACAPDCRSAGMCGNGIVDPGEECDDGLDMAAFKFNCDNCDCRSDCIVNRCGDGYANTTGPLHKEVCDGATPVAHGSNTAVPTETAGCNLDCTMAKCGDGKVNGHAGEECDPPNAGAHCNASCKLTVCP